jgi:myo-inositol-1(or 4)-monophosphatase
MTEAELDHYLAVAQLAAARASALLAASRRTLAMVVAEEGREVKVAADAAAEAVIVETLRQLAPLPVLSEETGWIDAGGPRTRFWAVDPLDGSVNYAQGYPHCGPSVALVVEGRPILGVVDVFPLGETFTGAVGRGAWLNGAPIRPSKVEDPARGVLNTGAPARLALDSAAQAQFMAQLVSWRKVRMIGSAAAAIAYVACGRADGYHERGGMIWDVAGACAVAAAAGCAVRIDGALDAPLSVTVSNGVLPEAAPQGTVAPD